MLKREKKKNKRIDRFDYAYTSGRYRALEKNLLSNSTMAGMFEAEREEEIIKVLADHGYTIGPDLVQSLKDDLSEKFELAVKLIPDRRYIDVLLYMNDYHNIKVILKYLVTEQNEYLSKKVHSPQKYSEDTKYLQETGDSEDNEDVRSYLFSQKTELNPENLSDKFALPAKYDPYIIWETLLTPSKKLEDERLEKSYRKALEAFIRDDGSIEVIDRVLDRACFEHMVEYDKVLNNDFLHELISYKADSVNLGILLRLRAMKAVSSDIENILVPGGTVEPDKLISLIGESNDAVKKAFGNSAATPLLDYMDTYGDENTVMEFGRATDNILIEIAHKAKSVLLGPEIIMAYLIVNQMQVKNINIALTCLRNNVPKSMARDIRRIL